MLNLQSIISQISIIESHNINENIVLKHISIDSRDISEGAVFFALIGKNHNAHDHIKSAYVAGARVFFVSEYNDDTRALIRDGVTIILVSDTLKAYQQLASIWRHSLSGMKVIAITGSNGKTSSKDILANILAEKGNVVYTHQNENNEIGVPKTIFRCNEETDYLILEYGMRGLGQIAELVNIAQQDYALITNIGTSHIGILGSQENIAKAKAEIFSAQKRGIHVYLSILDQKILTPYILGSRQHFMHFFGVKDTYKPIDKTYASIMVKGLEFRFASHHIGILNNICGLIELCTIIGIDSDTIQRGLDKYIPAEGRGKIYSLQDNITLIDETYNASPEAIRLMADTLTRQYDSVMLILGEVGEQGEHAIDAITHALQGIKAEQVYYLQKDIEIGSIEGIKIYQDREAMLSDICKCIIPNMTIGIKASRYMKFEEIRDYIITKYRI